MFSVGDCDYDEPIERKKYGTKFVTDFLHCIDARDVELAKVTLIWVRSKNKDNKDRPITITCIKPEQRHEVMQKVANLKYIPEGLAQEHFKKVSVTHDMSKAERQVNKLKISEAKLKTANKNQDGKFIYKVSGC